MSARLGVGLGWRPEIDRAVQDLDVDWVEVVAENLDARRLPASIRALRQRGKLVLPHAVTLSLGGAEVVDRQRVRNLAAVAEALDAPLVSDHVAFVRGGGLKAGHQIGRAHV